MTENKVGYIPKEDRKKILLITDDLRSFSGVGSIGREIVLKTAHHFNWVQIGGSMKHPEEGKRLDLSEDTNKHLGINDASVILYPASGYGNPDMLRQIIKMEKVDALLLITDPRYFIWLFMMENEIRKQIPICYLNIWDSPQPYCLWNAPYYEACDLLMGISKQTVNINKQVLNWADTQWQDLDNPIILENNKKTKPNKILLKYIPHGLDHNNFKPLDSSNQELIDFKKQLYQGKEYDFVLFFNSRNIRRKQIPDAMLAYKLFCDALPLEKAKKCAFVLHTEIVSEHGTDLEAVREYLLDGERYNVIFIPQALSSPQMNLLYNATDAQILLTDNEGWGLSLTEAILVGNPIIANVQGGMQDQMRFEDVNGKWIDFSFDFPSNHRGTYQKHGEWAFPVYPSNISIQGSPPTPYISSDRVKPEDAAKQIMEVYGLRREERKRRGLVGREWAISDEAGFTSKHQGDRVIEALDQLFSNWKPREQFELVDTSKVKSKSLNQKFIY